MSTPTFWKGLCGRVEGSSGTLICGLFSMQCRQEATRSLMSRLASAWPPHRLSGTFATLRDSKMPVMNAFEDFLPRGKNNDEAVTLQQETVPCAELVSFCEEVSRCQFDFCNTMVLGPL